MAVRLPSGLKLVLTRYVIMSCVCLDYKDRVSLSVFPGQASPQIIANLQMYLFCPSVIMTLMNLLICNLFNPLAHYSFLLIFHLE